MKKIFLVAVLAVTAAGVSSALGAPKSAPPITARDRGSAGTVAGPSIPPSYCQPPACLYYSGDLNLSNPYATGLANWHTLWVGSAAVYQPVRPTLDWRVTGMVFNILSDVSFVDPASTPWEIRTGVSPGNGGSIYASGSSVATFTPTGRAAFGLTEYTLKVMFPTAVILHRNVTYWVNALPQCTNGADSACTSYATYYLSTVDPPAAPVNHYGPPNIVDGAFFNSSFFSYNFALANTTPCSYTGCDVFSVGIIGAKVYKV